MQILYKYYCHLLECYHFMPVQYLRNIFTLVYVIKCLNVKNKHKNLIRSLSTYFSLFRHVPLISVQTESHVCFSETSRTEPKISFSS